MIRVPAPADLSVHRVTAVFNDPRIPICLSLLVLTCGQVLLWRRRDNVLGYIQGGLFFATMFVPVLATTVVSDADPEVVDQYVRILVIGALAFGAGLCFGAPFGKLPSRLSFSFAQRLSDALPGRLLKRARVIAIIAVLSLAASWLLLGYVPFFAADRRAAKYGIGVYAAGFNRGALLYHVALAGAGAILPVMLGIYYRRRRFLDLVISAALVLSVLLTLSRGDAFTGPLLFVLALTVERGLRTWVIFAVACTAFLGGALANELLYTSPPTAGSSFAARVGASAPDVRDQLGFLEGFRVNGHEHVGLRIITSAFGLEKGEWDPADYALRVLTGLHDVSGLAAGGLRLPAPIWGYATYGLLGTVVWSFVSGFFTGWGTVKIRELLDATVESPGSAFNLILAATFYSGTFGLLASFYFPERSGLVFLLIALSVGLTRSKSSDDSVVQATRMSHLRPGVER